MQHRVYRTLVLDKDIPIVDMYKSAYPDSSVNHIKVRVMQQRLGSVIARANKKLTSERIIPGQLKQTYRLERATKDS